jgi:hypothetical protein
MQKCQRQQYVKKESEPLDELHANYMKKLQTFLCYIFCHDKNPKLENPSSSILNF